MNENTVQLPKEVAKEYQLVGFKGSPKQFFGSFGTLDMTKLTLKKAKILVDGKFPYLKKRPQPVAKTEAK